MNMMANAGPYGGPYGQSAGQGMPGAGLGPQLQNKAAMPNNIANQFNMDKKTLPGQGMPGMVSQEKSWTALFCFHWNWLESFSKSSIDHRAFFTYKSKISQHLHLDVQSKINTSYTGTSLQVVSVQRSEWFTGVHGCHTKVWVWFWMSPSLLFITQILSVTSWTCKTHPVCVSYLRPFQVCLISASVNTRPDMMQQHIMPTWFFFFFFLPCTVF